MVQLFERVLDETSPDLVHVQHLMGMPVALIRSIKQRGIPFVITLWDFWWICANAQLLTNYSREVCDGPQAYLNCARCALARINRPRFWLGLPALAGLSGWRNWLLRRVIGAATRIVAPTDFVRRWHAAHGVPMDQLCVLPPGLESAAVARGSQRRPDRGTVRIAYIGGLSWQKGVHTLVDAFRCIQDRGELWIAGDESFDPIYVARLRAQAGPGVRFLGRLEREEVWQTLGQVDVVAVPSMWYETFSFLVSEAFTVGVPVVASRLGTLADRVHDGVDGLLISPGDVDAWGAALKRLVREPGLLARLQSNVRPPMTHDEHISRIESLYAETNDITSDA
jgi:glycosyltransferase involved in cell wall biosynthesis